MKERSKRGRRFMIPPELRRPEGWLRFLQTSTFKSDWKDLALCDEHLRDLEITILKQPQGPPVVAGTAGLRKIRFAPHDWRTGKSGAIRVGYTCFPTAGLVALLVAYQKGEKDDLTPDEKRQIRELIGEIQKDIEKGKVR